MLKNNILGTLSAQEEKLWVDDVFSTTLYQGNGSTQTINNGIDLAGKGGLVWLKMRGSYGGDSYYHSLHTTALGYSRLSTNSVESLGGTDGLAGSNPYSIGGYLSNGFNLIGGIGGNGGSTNFVSWTFRKSQKFFDVVTYTGNGVAGRQIPHSLGVAPGMIVVKSLTSAPSTNSWVTYHRSLGATKWLYLNTTDPANTSSGPWNNTNPTATDFTVGWSNDSGIQYVAYLFAHDPSADGIIQCGSFAPSGLTNVSLGWEPQYVMIKRVDSPGNWVISDSMRGMPEVTSGSVSLLANSSVAEAAFITIGPSSTGFTVNGLSGTYIYLAIRRPNKPPTTGTQVFKPSFFQSALNNADRVFSGFPVDLSIWNVSDPSSKVEMMFFDRLRYKGNWSFNTNSETGNPFVNEARFDSNTGLVNRTGGDLGTYPYQEIFFNFRRAPGFFDVVCYDGTEVTKTVAHNLTVVPELYICKKRVGTNLRGWATYSATLGATKGLYLNTSDASAIYNWWNDTAPTATVFTVSGSSAVVNETSSSYVAYLFASLPGISKVFSYTGNGTSQTINCGFSAGARFILIKRTDSTGDWYVWDSARGIVAANDPHLSLNTTAAEVTTNDSVDPDSTGFIVNQNVTTNINVLNGTYIGLAIA